MRGLPSWWLLAQKTICLWSQTSWLPDPLRPPHPHLPHFSLIDVAVARSLACSQPHAFVRQQKEQPVSTLQSFSYLSRSIFGVFLPGCTPAPVCLVDHMARRVVSSLTWGGHTPVFFSQIRKYMYSMSQISPSDIYLEPLSQVTGGNCTFGTEIGLCGW